MPAAGIATFSRSWLEEPYQNRWVRSSFINYMLMKPLFQQREHLL